MATMTFLDHVLRVREIERYVRTLMWLGIVHTAVLVATVVQLFTLPV